MQQRISDWVKKFNIVVVPCEERPDKPTGDVVYRLKDLFTTCEGKWEPASDMGSLPQWARDAYLRPWAPTITSTTPAGHSIFLPASLT